MKRNLYMRFPGMAAKALTLSYDDGVQQDARLMEILDRHGLKCTFNINSGSIPHEGKVYPEGQIHRRMTASECVALYKNSGHEVAVHGHTHPFLEQLPQSGVVYEVMKDRVELEKMFGLSGGAGTESATTETAEKDLKTGEVATVNTKESAIDTLGSLADDFAGV